MHIWRRLAGETSRLFCFQTWERAEGCCPFNRGIFSKCTPGLWKPKPIYTTGTLCKYNPVRLNWLQIIVIKFFLQEENHTGEMMRKFITTLNPGLMSPSVNLNIHFFAAMMKESLFFHNNGKDSRHMSLLCTFIRDYAPVSTLLKCKKKKRRRRGSPTTAEPSAAGTE